MAVEQKQLDAFEQLVGKRGAHSDLARECEEIGLYTCSPDNERSLVLLQGCWASDGSDIVVGKIVGDADAVVESS